MTTLKEEKRKTKPAKSDNSISIKDFTDTEQATIVLAAHHVEQSVGQFLRESIKRQIESTITITYENAPIGQER